MIRKYTYIVGKRCLPVTENWKVCPDCAAPIVFNGSFGAQCTQCGYEYHPLNIDDVIAKGRATTATEAVHA